MFWGVMIVWFLLVYAVYSTISWEHWDHKGIRIGTLPTPKLALL